MVGKTDPNPDLTPKKKKTKEIIPDPNLMSGNKEQVCFEKYIL